MIKEWEKQDKNGDFSAKFTLNTSIFKSNYIYTLLRDLNYGNVGYLHSPDSENR